MQKKPITNKLLWIFAVGQFGWSLLSGIVANWMVYYYTGTPDEQNPLTGIFASGITQHPIVFKLTLFGLVLAVGRIFDAITDPLIAGWSDRAKYKGGRRIPFMRTIAVPFNARTSVMKPVRSATRSTGAFSSKSSGFGTRSRTMTVARQPRVLTVSHASSGSSGRARLQRSCWRIP